MIRVEKLRCKALHRFFANIDLVNIFRLDISPLGMVRKTENSVIWVYYM